MDQIMRSADVCKALSISKPTLYRLTKSGVFCKVNVSKGRVGWLQSSVEAYINSLKPKA